MKQHQRTNSRFRTGIVAVSAGALALVGAGSLFAGFAAASEEGLEQPSAEMQRIMDAIPEKRVGEDSGEISTENVDLVLSLDARGRCLFDHGVYPEGSVGFENGKTPYDEMGGVAAASGNLRMEVLKHHAERIADIDLTGTSSVVVKFAHSESGTSPEALLASVLDTDRARRLAAELRGHGVSLVAEVSKADSVLNVCAKNETLRDALDKIGLQGNWTSTINEETGATVIHCPRELHDKLRAVVEPLDGNYEFEHAEEIMVYTAVAVDDQ